MLKKKRLILPFALCLILSVSVAASSMPDNADIIQGYAPDGPNLLAFVANSDSSAPSAEQYSASLNNQSVPVLAADTVSGQPITYYCLADISGSLNDEQMEQEKAALTAIFESMTPQDRMVVAKFGNKVTPSEYFTKSDELSAAIQALAVQKSEDTNLYGAIVDSLDELLSSRQATTRKCLAVLTDGQDDQKSSYTKDEVEKKISASKIPVYGVAVMKSSEAKNESRIQYAKILGSFSRQSAGGVYFNPVLKENCETASEAGYGIASSMGNCVQLTLDVSGVNRDEIASNSVPLEIRYTSGDSLYVDVMEVRTQDLPAPQPELEPVPEPEPEPEPEPSFLEKALKTPWPWVGIALVALIVILLIVRSNKRRREEEERRRLEELERQELERKQREEEAERQRMEALAREEAERRQREEEAERRRREEEEEARKRQERTPTRLVTFSALGYRNISFNLHLPEEKAVTLGRDGRADFALNPQDAKLSGVNTRVFLQGQYLLVMDAGSTNGTGVNGVSVKAGETVKMGNNGVLRMGSYEYRVRLGPRSDA